MKSNEILNKIVVDMITKHKGGEAFFDNLDENMKNESIMRLLFEMIDSDAEKRSLDADVVLSGKFGIYLCNAFTEKNGPLLVNGGLREGKIISLEPFEDRIKGNTFVFIDDSFYLGRTRDAIKAEIEKWGGRLTITYVCYDGSIVKDQTVKSLYRYYDHFKQEDL